MESIVMAIRIVSFVVIFIIMAVVANVMAMTARERLAEYATIKALGFSPGFVALLVVGEALTLSLIGAAIGILITLPIAAGFAASPAGAMFAVFNVSNDTILLQIACALTVGIVASLVPAWRSANMQIVDGLRHVG